ncbi:ZIP zinc transporter domain-containing protein [Ditylenchus destructor]|uniref:ZIP zinc transporter domain-containing protein n=1 Tax=Ditylenchus destructor TaxID=166010 RepID=A0AAD4QXY7_9BILA|nr:ZIP zinc transporter domain-containing protein [Ditylenchus destructor]
MSTILLHLRNSSFPPEIPPEETPELWQTWFYGLLIVTAASFLSPLGMLMVPLLSKNLYDRFMTFLVALGIGAMSGSCIFILIPQAFNITELTKFDYMTKSWIIITALYSFFVVDRILSVVIELRRRNNCRRKIHLSTLEAILEKSKPTKNQKKQSTSKNGHAIQPQYPMEVLATATSLPKNVQNGNIGNCEETELHNRTEKECQGLEDDVEVGMNYNALTRTLSTRKTYAVVKQEHNARNAPDKIQFEAEDGSLYNIDSKALSRQLSADCSEHMSRTYDLESGKFHNQNTQTDHHSAFCEGYSNGGYASAMNSPKLSKADPVVDVSVQVHEKHVIERGKAEVASVAYMIIFGSSANNFVDGMSTGAAFSDSIIRGLTIGLAVLSQQFPQELGTLAILVNSGLGIKRAILYNMIPITLSYFGFAAGVIADSMDDSFDSFVFCVSAGMYLYIFLGTLLPEIRDSFNEVIKRDLWEAALCTILQFSGIAFGVAFLYFMHGNDDNDDEI